MTASLKFKDQYVEPIVKGSKKTTWRVGYEKSLDPGDVISLVDEHGEEFAIARIDWCKRTQIRFMNDADFRWHNGDFRSDSKPETPLQAQKRLQELYPQYDVDYSTNILVVRFRVKEEIDE